MARPKSRITSGELEILSIFWATGTCTKRDVHEALNRKQKVAKSTVDNRLWKMEAKGLIKAEDDRQPRVYVAAIKREQTTQSLVGDLLKRVSGISIADVVSHIVSAGKLTDDERKKIRDDLKKIDD